MVSPDHDLSWDDVTDTTEEALEEIKKRLKAGQ
jgi:hypothetical protein